MAVVEELLKDRVDSDFPSLQAASVSAPCAAFSLDISEALLDLMRSIPRHSAAPFPEIDRGDIRDTLNMLHQDLRNHGSMMVSDLKPFLREGKQHRPFLFCDVLPRGTSQYLTQFLENVQDPLWVVGIFLSMLAEAAYPFDEVDTASGCGDVETIVEGFVQGCSRLGANRFHSPAELLQVHRIAVTYFRPHSH
ncbi:hypothetical protein [Streptomyces sp. AC558_RSS880]|uniref:hypothetical protein n=1 Tax=Streptomyces sp. AC558_RSS880 TaxID=2823687 RepID=UPI001C250267|nr:hypothetical protein [Streptomyces sp. AC558_RSS880]